MRISSLTILGAFVVLALGSPAPSERLRKRGPYPKKKTTTASTKISSTSTSSVRTSSATSTSSSSLTTLSTSASVASSSTSSTATSSKAADASCTNGPLTRSCWSNGYSIAADFDTKFPSTGVTRYYDFTFTNQTYSPDGGPSRNFFLVNGQYPGPTVYADWGDTVQVTVHNHLADNGTGIHWHGIRQYHTNLEDGVPGVTECPLAPGDSKIYKFQASQYGTSWWHSHFSSQYGDGIVGPIVINGPATANYDVDLGPLPISDWFYTPVAELAFVAAHTPGLPPTADTGVINGTMVSSGGGKYYTTTITKGKKYRLRLINTSVDNHFMVSLDNHNFTVITSDFVPIQPYAATWIFLGIGQRYDVIVNANQTVGNYWFRAEVQDQAGCGANANNGNIKSIFSYTGAAAGDPTSSATNYTQRCTDEQGLTPYWNSFVPTGPMTTTDFDVAINIGVDKLGSQVVAWGVNLSALSVQWDKPVVQYVLEGNTSYPKSENLIQLPTAGQWYYWVIQEVAGIPFTVNVPHPIHLHGHDFFVLGTGVGNFSDVDPSTLDYTNPTRRDVAMLPTGGWLVLAFQTDNPGAWLMHCHIAWHAGEGLAVQFLESVSTMDSIDPPGTDFSTTCKNWDAYYPSQAYWLRDIDDSGI